MGPDWSAGPWNRPPGMPRPFPSLWDQSRGPKSAQRSKMPCLGSRAGVIQCFLAVLLLVSCADSTFSYLRSGRGRRPHRCNMSRSRIARACEKRGAKWGTSGSFPKQCLHYGVWRVYAHFISKVDPNWRIYFKSGSTFGIGSDRLCFSSLGRIYIWNWIYIPGPVFQLSGR